MRVGVGAWWMIVVAVAGMLAGPSADPALGQTIVGGVVDQDTTWTLAESPYLATETVELRNSAVLTIEPGVEIIFERDRGLDATRGVVIADGLGGGTIVFRSAEGEVGSWPGIVIGNVVPSIVTPVGEYVGGPIFRNVRIVEAVDAVQCRNGPAYFEMVTVERCRLGGLSFNVQPDSTIWFKNMTIRDAGLGLEVAVAQSVTLLDCVFEDNPGGGARIGVSDGGTVERCVFRRNGKTSAPIGGGGALLAGNWLVRACVFEGNEAIATSAFRGGGGLKLETVDSTIIDCDFFANTSRYAGGGAEVRPTQTFASVRVERCRFIGNESLERSGGGLLAGASGSTTALDVTVLDCLFEENRGESNGALVLGLRSGEVAGNMFVRNTARTSGGGIRIYNDTSDLLITGNEFTGNTTEAAGGAIDLSSVRSGDGLRIEGNTFRGNAADTGGAIGGIGGLGGFGDVRIIGNTFENNTARLGGATNIQPTLFWTVSLAGDGTPNHFSGNMADFGAAIYNDSPDAIDATGNCWGTSDPAAIAERIYDASDDPTKGAVAFDPIATDCDACEADLDGDGSLTIFDFLAFGNLFDLMDPRADFDGDGQFTIFDFLAFQNAFDAGCP